LEHYEAAMILSPNLADKDVAGFVTETKEMLARFGAADIAEPKVERRALAYPIKRHNEAHYVFIGFFGPAALPAQVKLELKHREEMLRLAFIRKPPAPAAPEPEETPASAPQAESEPAAIAEEPAREVDNG